MRILLAILLTLSGVRPIPSQTMTIINGNKAQYTEIDRQGLACNGTNGDNLRNATSDQVQAQQWTPTVSFSVARIRIWGDTVGSPTGNVFATIYSDSAGTPNAVLATSNNVAVSSLTSTFAEADFTFASPFAVTASTVYYLAVNGSYTISGTNFTRWCFVTGSSPQGNFGNRFTFTPWTGLSTQPMRLGVDELTP